MSGATQTFEIEGYGPTAFRRVLSLLLPVLLLAALMMVVADRADASTAAAGVAATATASGATAGAAQINFQAIVCPILLALRAFFLNSPFAGFLAGIFTSLLAAFGCVIPSG